MNPRSHVQIQQDNSPHEAVYQPRDVHTPAITQQKGVLHKRGFSLNRGPDYPTSLRIETVLRLWKVQYSRLGVSRGLDYPLPTETETVSATRNAHTTAQNSLSRGSVTPLSRESIQCRYRRSLKSGGPSTHSVHRNPHSSTDVTPSSAARTRV